jgi:hypothetical protein
VDEPEQPGPLPGPDPGPNPVPDPAPDGDDGDDGDFEEWVAWVEREQAAGRDPLPPEREPSQGISISLGDATDLDPALLAAICGPGGLGGQGLGPQFAQDAAADLLAPTPVLAALTEEAASDVTRLSDSQLIGVLRAARRLECREGWKKALVIAEFARRRAAEFEAARARGVPVHCRAGQFPGEELAAELILGPVQAAHAIDDAGDLATRLPCTLAGMASGLIDGDRAGIISVHTRCLSAQDAALADQVLAVLAPALRLDQLARKAAALAMRLDPEAVKARKERERRTRQRVEVRGEESGNASVAGREMDTADALASKAYMHALALGLRRAGLPGTLDQLRLAVFADLTSGRDPLDRITRPAAAPADPAAADRSGPGPAGDAPADPPAPGAAMDAATEDAAGGARGSGGPGEPADDDRAPDDNGAADDGKVPADSGSPGDVSPPGAPADEPGEHDTEAAPAAGGTGPRSLDYHHDGDDCDDYDDDCGGSGDPGVPGSPPARPPAPMPATINLLVPAGTLFGWDTTPSEAGGWGLLDADETRATVQAASQHPATRWCVTLLRPDGTAGAHGCSHGQHPWTPHDHQDAQSAQDQQHSARPPNPADPGGPPGPLHPAGPPRTATGRRMPTHGQAAQLAAFLRSLNITPEPIARGDCDHASAEPRYTPSRKLAHLVRARTATCDAPACGAQAAHADLDHTTPYPDGATDQCNLGPKCRRHHKCKQAPGWKVEQAEPGVIRWTLPSGRIHTTTPTVYDPCTWMWAGC